MRRVSAEGIALIKSFEGCRLDCYRDIRGIPTIGWGQTGPDIRMGLRWTQEQADARFLEHLRKVEDDVERMLKGQRIPDSVFDAVCSWVYNVGSGNAEKSTLMRKLRKGDLLGAWGELSRWVFVDSALTPGLIRRRKAEQDHWNKFLRRGK